VRIPVRALTLTLALALICPVAAGCASSSEADEATTQDAIRPFSAAKAASAALEEARDDQQAIDSRLGHELATVGPALTEAQNRAYARGFYALADNKAVRAKYLESTETLSKEISAILASPTQLQSITSPVAGRGTPNTPAMSGADLYHAVVLLAESPSADVALKFAARALSGDPDLAKLGKSQKQIEDEILGPALPNAFVAKLLTERNSDTALESVRDMLGTASGAAPHVQTAIDELRRNHSKPVSIKAFEARPLGKFVTGLGVALSIWEMGEGLSEAAKGNAREGLEQFLTSSASAAEGVGVAAGTYRMFLNGGVAPKWAGQVATVAARVGAGITGVFAVLTTIDSAKRWNDGVGEKIEVLANCLTVASAIGAVVGATALSGGLGLVATGALFLAHYLKANQLANLERAERQKILPMVGLPENLTDKNLIETLVDAEPAMLSQLAGTLGMKPEDIQWLGSEYPGAITGITNGVATDFRGLIYLDELFGLTGGEVTAFFKALVQGETIQDRRTFAARTVTQALSIGVAGAGPFNATNKTAALAWFDKAAADTTLFTGAEASASWKAACGRGRAYLVTQ